MADRATLAAAGAAWPRSDLARLADGADGAAAAPTHGAHRGQRLLSSHTLRHDEAACLPLRSRHGQCRACAEVCPVGALGVGLDAVRLSEDCIGCGRCTAACPTQALSLPELADVGVTPPAAGVAAVRSVRLECRKVPASQHAAGTQTLPCLGALTPGHLLAMAAQGADVQVVDRGWCTGCEANPEPVDTAAISDLPSAAASDRSGCPDATVVAQRDGCAASAPHPATASIDMAVLWLQAVDSPVQVRLVSQPLTVAQRPESIPPVPEPEPPMARRQFFRAAMERPTGRQRATPMGGDGRAAFPSAGRQPSPERERQHTALKTLAERRGTAVPAEFFPGLHADSRCCDARMCVALCPTAALSAVDDGQAAHLRFDPLRCIACGTCERACPESALTLSPQGGQAGPQLLISHTRQRCPTCGDVFTPPARDEAEADAQTAALCPACAKAQRFMADARRQLFGATR